MRVQLTTHVYVNQKNANKTYKNCMQLQIKKFYVKKLHVHAQAWDICLIRYVWVSPFVFWLLAVYHFKEYTTM